MSQREKEANEVMEIERFTSKMNDKNSESFEEWCKSNGFCSSYVPMQAWNHQQKKIDELENRDINKMFHRAMSDLAEANLKLQAAEEENKILREAVEAVSWHGCLTGDCPHDTKGECYMEMIKLSNITDQALEKVGGGE